MRTDRVVMRPHRAGPVVCALLVAAAAGWARGWAWVVVPALLALLGVSACAVGTDSRAPGDWGSGSHR